MFGTYQLRLQSANNSLSVFLSGSCRWFSISPFNIEGYPFLDSFSAIIRSSLNYVGNYVNLEGSTKWKITQYIFFYVIRIELNLIPIQSIRKDDSWEFNFIFSFALEFYRGIFLTGKARESPSDVNIIRSGFKLFFFL